MPATATVNGKQEHAAVNNTEETDSEEKPIRRGNPLMKSLTPDMIKNPHELEFADGMMSDRFAWEKTNKTIVEALEFKTEKEWLDFAKAVWKWRQDAEKRQAEAAAEKLLAEASENPLLLELLKQKLAT